MKYKIFDVVRMKNNNKATILDILEKNKYFVEIVNIKGETVDKKVITENEIEKPEFIKGKLI